MKFNKMIYTIATYLLVIMMQASVLAGSAKDGELEVHTLFKSEDCTRKAKPTDVLTLHYKGTLEDGTVFDSSYARDEKFSFQLGIGQVIKGWDKGLIDICEGEKRKLVIPPSLGYGSIQHQKIPANSILTFEIECFKIEDGPNPANVFKDIDKDGDDKLSREEVQEFLKVQLAGNNDITDQSSVLDEIFKHEDQDSDGFITKAEFSGPKYDHEEL